MENYRAVKLYEATCILGDPGATSRDDAIFSGERHFWRESFLQGLNSPWALFLTRRVPEVVEIRPADWPEKLFSGQSTRRSSRESFRPLTPGGFLHRSI